MSTPFRTPHRVTTDRGVTLIELIVVVGLIGTLAAISQSLFTSTLNAVEDAGRDVADNLRMTRALAIREGREHRMRIHTESVFRVIDRKTNATTGIVESIVLNQFELPAKVRFVIPTLPIPKEIRFASDGTLIPEAGDPVPLELVVEDTRDSRTRTLELWASGQVVEPS